MRRAGTASSPRTITPGRSIGNKIPKVGPAGPVTHVILSPCEGYRKDFLSTLDVARTDAGATTSAQDSRADHDLKDVKLRLGAPPPGEQHPAALYAEVLKELLGDEMRQLLRAELKAVLDLPMTTEPSFGAREECSARADTIACAGAQARRSPRPASERCDSEAHDDSELGDKGQDKRTKSPTMEAAPVANSKFFDESVADALMDGIRLDGRDLSIHYHKKRLLEIIAARASTTTAQYILTVDRYAQKLGSVEAPNQVPRLKAILESNAWNTLVSFMIVLNCSFMVVSLDWQITHPDESTSNLSLDTSRDIFLFECVFLVFYLLEFVLKLANHGRYYFINANWKLNILDVVLILGNLWTILLSLFSGLNRIIQNITWLRLLRLLSLLKAVRVLRVASAFSTLRAILASVADSLHQLFWCSVMLLVVLFMFALAFVSRLTTFLHSESDTLDPTLKDNILASFGSVAKSMVSLFMAATGGNDWSYYYNLWTATGGANQALFLFFIAFIEIALLNIILGVFVDCVMKNLRPDTGQLAAEQADEEEQNERDLRKLCLEADTNGDGRMSLREWNRILSDGKLTTYLHMLGFRSQDLQDFFWGMSRRHPDGDVSIDEFVTGCMRLKGNASCFSVQSLLFEVKDMRDSLLQEHEELRLLLSEMRLSRSRKPTCTIGDAPADAPKRRARDSSAA